MTEQGIKSAEPGLTSAEHRRSRDASWRLPMTLFDLSGRIAVITGGNGGIGLGMAKGMAAAGAAIVVAGRDAEKNSAAVQEIQSAGGKASAIPVDVLKEESCRGLI